MNKGTSTGVGWVVLHRNGSVESHLDRLSHCPTNWMFCRREGTKGFLRMQDDFMRLPSAGRDAYRWIRCQLAGNIDHAGHGFWLWVNWFEPDRIEFGNGSDPESTFNFTRIPE